ncbi:MAG: hypothetical protein Q9170_003840 [Blastenia crenularia]
MGSIKKYAIAVLTFSFLIFVVLFGQVPALRRGPIGMLSRFIRLRIPEWLIKIDNVSTGGRMYSYLNASFDYLMNRNHPLILVGHSTLARSRVVI